MPNLIEISSRVPVMGVFYVIQATNTLWCTGKFQRNRGARVSKSEYSLFWELNAEKVKRAHNGPKSLAGSSLVLTELSFPVQGNAGMVPWSSS
jgi:hypothetical protein